MVIASLATLPLLEDIRLNVSLDADVVLHIDRLSTLRRIAVTGFRGNPIVEQLIARSPQLSALDVDGTRCRVAADILSLHDFFSQLSPATPLPLTHLRVWNICLRLDSTTIPHFRELTSLNLGPILHPMDRSRSWLPDPADEGVHRMKDVCSTASEIWRTLSHERILLREVTVATTDDALLDYLASYSGVEKLVLSGIPVRNITASNALADKFYTRVLPRHTESLRILKTPLTFEGKWCYDFHVSNALLECRHLTHLTIPLYRHNLEDTVRPFDSAVAVF